MVFLARPGAAGTILPPPPMGRRGRPAFVCSARQGGKMGEGQVPNRQKEGALPTDARQKLGCGDKDMNGV